MNLFFCSPTLATCHLGFAILPSLIWRGASLNPVDLASEEMFVAIGHPVRPPPPPVKEASLAGLTWLLQNPIPDGGLAPTFVLSFEARGLATLLLLGGRGGWVFCALYSAMHLLPHVPPS